MSSLRGDETVTDGCGELIFERVSVRRRIQFISEFFKIPCFFRSVVAERQQRCSDLGLVGRCGSRLLFQSVIQSNVLSDTRSSQGMSLASGSPEGKQIHFVVTMYELI